MKLDKICRTCLLEKASLKPLFGSCVPNMLMSCCSIQVIEGDGLPNQICTQCLQMVNRSYCFKQQCEKSDVTLRQYIHNLELQSLTEEANVMDSVKADQLIASSDVLQQSSLFQDIFNDASTQSLVQNFTCQTDSAVSDLAETMQSLQTIAEQCLPETWETDTQIISCQSTSDETSSTLNISLSLFRCEFCEGAFKDEWDLAEHMKVHTGQSKYFCSICGKVCSNPTLLNKHIIEHSLNNSQSGGQKLGKTLICDMCNKTFSDAKYLRKHLKEVHLKNSDDKTCHICDKSYKHNKLLMFHMRSHTGERPLSCDICGRRFALPSSLHKHKKIHTSEKKFKCILCEKQFNQSSNLTTHMNTHLGEKSHICSICGKGVATAVNLRIHMRTHTGLKPYKCIHCDNAFATSGQLKKHLMCHTGEKPYNCYHCGKFFRRKETRDTHVRYHTGERPFSCTLCSKKYIAASHLRVHLKSHREK